VRFDTVVNGFAIKTSDQLTFDLSCRSVGAPWQGFATIYFISG